MEETVTIHPHKPLRRRRTKMEIFKEAYLPYLILFVAAIVILILIIGAVVRNGAV